ncbi:2Fe-2S iron-sulfur cluster-binding protein [Limibacter armeniacum]|uniref:2Fe-2S iron-sulfur cluster-binding protein n=1 Tax=Limibacter armeniacum TaxID=466084 RepID=UPI002FE6079D
MPSILIKNLDNKQVNVAEQHENALQAIQEEMIDWMYACGGNGRCTSCKATIEDGADNFASLSEAEIRFREMGRLQENERLMCQAKVKGHVEVSVPDACKFPHMNYSS